MISIRHLIGGATRGRLICKAACRPPRGVIDQGWLCPVVGESGVKHKRSITNNQGPLNSAAAAVSPIQGDEVRELQPGDFHDPKSIYQFKSFFELVKATFVFQLCKFNFIVDNSLKIMVVGEKLLGRRLFKFLSRPVIYDQFVGRLTYTIQNNVLLLLVPPSNKHFLVTQNSQLLLTNKFLFFVVF